ncbi:MAG: hypothetical protein RQ867_02645 [Mariprofundaceae bacterium]|nr:hypothetical protein [Mariprofundaceae bacterium]
MKQTLVAAALLLAAWLAWQAWQPPVVSQPGLTVRSALPEVEDAGPELWRIVTRRMVWKQAIASMRDRLYREGFETRLIVIREPVELHAFDDPRSFKTMEEAEKVKEQWQKKKIDAEALKREVTYGVALGRFYITSYAEQMQARLKSIGLPYLYERRTVIVPAYRFVFEPMQKEQAEKSWKRLQNLGIADPAMMKESEFQRLYGTQAAP